MAVADVAFTEPTLIMEMSMLNTRDKISWITNEKESNATMSSAQGDTKCIVASTQTISALNVAVSGPPCSSHSIHRRDDVAEIVMNEKLLDRRCHFTCMAWYLGGQEVTTNCAE